MRPMIDIGEKYNNNDFVSQDHSGSSLPEVDMVQTSAYRSRHQKSPRLVSSTTVCSNGHMADRGKY